jgi:outer membrane receptor protein involved in Fe transport
MTSIRGGLRGILFAGTALGAAALSGAAFAQAPAPVPASSSNPNAIEEVVVTATRQTSTVNKVALSVSAVTQKSLDQQGIRSVQDLSTQVPGFTYRVSGGDNNPNLTLRGIGGNAIAGTSGSAPTTGVYLDDTPLMKRNVNSLETGSGSPLPLLYDLDRIEVLRGPQGTLYGGSSEGGTLRFISPTPSLTTYSGSARLGASTMAGGGNGDEEGLALGGPLVQDKLGFRISGFRQDRPGWVDESSEYDGHKFANNVNWGDDYALRAALLWQITPNFKATLSVFNQMNYDNDSSAVRTNSPALNIPVITFHNTGLVNNVVYSFPQTVYGGYTIPAVNGLNGRDGNVQGLYLTPTNPIYQNSPRRSLFTVPSLTLDYNWNDKLDFKSITSYIMDRSGGTTFTGGFGMRTTVFPNLTAQPCPSGQGSTTAIHLTGTQTLANGCTIAPTYLQLPAYGGGPMYTTAQLANQIPGPANVFGNYLYNNRRGETTQEFRVSTVDPSWRLQFVGGLYIMANNNHVNNGSNWNEDLEAYQLRGMSESYTAGGSAVAPDQLTPGNVLDDVATRNIDIVEHEYSAFADVTFAVTSKFKINVGVRGTYYQQHFTQIYGGVISGPPTFVNGAGVKQVFSGAADDGLTTTVNGVTYPYETNPNSLTPFPTNYAACPKTIHEGATNPTPYIQAGCPYQYTDVSFTEKPVTPKIGASYQLTNSDLLYVTYSEGERPGGVNPPVPPVQCAADFANLGITQVPFSYQHDTVKSTEVGGKFRLFDGQLQVNTSAFHIEWDGVQFVVSLPQCAFSYIANAAKAYSDGAELQATGRLGHFTFNGNLGYDNARYAATVKNLNGSILANKGDNLGVPDWTANVGVQYDTHIMEFPAYVRADYAYTGNYMRTTSAGSATYNAAITPNFINGDETHIINARAGLYYKDLEIAFYVKNAGNSMEWINKNQGVGTYYYTGNTVIPRTVGAQMNYRF